MTASATGRGLSSGTAALLVAAIAGIALSRSVAPGVAAVFGVAAGALALAVTSLLATVLAQNEEKRQQQLRKAHHEQETRTPRPARGMDSRLADLEQRMTALEAEQA